MDKAKTLTLSGVHGIEEEMTLIDAIRTIQRNERGRQGKLRAKFAMEIKLQADNDKYFGVDTEINMKVIAVTMQRMVRGHLARIHVRRLRSTEMKFLGMKRYEEGEGGDHTLNESNTQTDHDLSPLLSNPIQLANRNHARRHDLGNQHEQAYQEALVSIKERLMLVEGPEFRETLQDEFRQWYMDIKRQTGKFPDFPDMEEWSKPQFSFAPNSKKHASEVSAGNPIADSESQGFPALLEWHF